MINLLFFEKALQSNKKIFGLGAPVKGNTLINYFKKLSDCGFRVEAVDYTSQLTSEEIEKYRLAKGEIIPVVYKP